LLSSTTTVLGIGGEIARGRLAVNMAASILESKQIGTAAELLTQGRLANDRIRAIDLAGRSAVSEIVYVLGLAGQIVHRVR
jgi:hypothetical protein